MAVQQKDSFRLAATGDAILTRELLPYEGVSERFDRLLGTLRDADATVTNLEVLVHDYDNYPAAASGGTYMRAPPAVLDELAGMGCDLFSAATNHTFDFTHGGIEDTLYALEARDLRYAGLGESLYEARKPTYLETPAGRVGMVSACSTITPGSEAGERSRTLGGRPGLNPLHVDQVYRVTEDELDRLREVSESAGLEAMKRDWFDRGLLFGHDWDEEAYFHFGDMKFRPVDHEGETGVTYEVDATDRAAVLEWVRDADRNADWVVATVHAHEGVGGLQTTQETPAFLVEFAHAAVDAGADAVVGTGPHVLRGIEVYDGRPIFYSLGNFVVQNETVARLPPESFERYGLEDHTKVSNVFDARLYEDGEPKGDLAQDAFWQTVVPVCRFSGDELDRVELYPCDLQRERPRPQRGIPVLADTETAEEIVADLGRLSERFGTIVTLEDGVGALEL